MYRGVLLEHPSMREVLDMKVALPDKEEQIKIANFLSEIDVLIKSAENEVSLQGAVEESYASENVSKKCEKVPEIRFP